MSRPIEVSNAAVIDLLTQMQSRVDDLSPVLLAIGDDMVEGIKQRFASATGPDGTPWAANAQSTIINYIRRRGGLSSKTGKITAKGQQLAINKRPLQGESGDLARQLYSLVASGHTLLVSSTMKYAAMQQFGGTKDEFAQLWGDIPARPFFPITPDGALYPQEEDKITARIQQYLML